MIVIILILSRFSAEYRYNSESAEKTSDLQAKICRDIGFNMSQIAKWTFAVRLITFNKLLKFIFLPLIKRNRCI